MEEAGERTGRRGGEEEEGRKRRREGGGGDREGQGVEAGLGGGERNGRMLRGREKLKKWGWVKRAQRFI